MPLGTWSVQVELTTSLIVTDDVVREIVERLDVVAATVSSPDDHRVEVRLTVETPTVRAAFQAERAVSAALADLLPDAEVVAVHVIAEQRQGALPHPR